MKKLLIYGCGYPSITSLITYLNTSRGQQWEIEGYIDDSKFGKQDEYMGYPIVGNENSIPGYAQKGYYFFNNVASSCQNMETVYRKLAEHNAKICTLVFPEPPDIDLDTVDIGRGSLISPQVIVGANVTLGKNVIVRQQTIVSHDSRIGDYCFIGPNVGIMGGVSVGPKTFIGAKALLRENITIGSNCIIGMGAVVTKDVPDHTTVIGNPAKPIQTKKPADKKAKETAHDLFITNS
jgi:sugar O-acyltransferase (sialic acid O-acetyltransferase NeuD family)